MESLIGTSISPALLIALMVWTLPWKGFALWKASRLSHRGWFIVIFLINSLAILDIIYIFFIASRYSVETEEIEATDGDEEAERQEEAE